MVNDLVISHVSFGRFTGVVTERRQHYSVVRVIEPSEKLKQHNVREGDEISLTNDRFTTEEKEH